MTAAALTFEPFLNSSDLLGRPAELRERFTQQGYLYLKDVLDPALLAALRADVAAICEQEQWLKNGSPAIDLHTWTKPTVEGEAEYFKVYDRIQMLERFHALSHEPSLHSIMETLLGGPSFPHPLAVARLMFPFNTPWATPPHQDYPNNQGTEDLYACWIPLGDCPIEQGPLAISPGSHKRGMLPLKFALGAGHRQVFDKDRGDFDWVSGPMAAGDVLIFHSLTVHRSMPNQSSSLRLSVDYRYQHEGQALVEQSLQPHFKRQSWDQIYEGWTSDALKHYWRKRDYTLVDWDESLHADIEEPMQEQVSIKRRYENYREEVSQQFQPANKKD